MTNKNLWVISSVVIEPRLKLHLHNETCREMKRKRTFFIVLFSCVIGVTQVETQSLTDYIFRPASTLVNTLTSGLTGGTSGQGQKPNRNERPAQPQIYSTNQQFVNSYQRAPSCANFLSYQSDSSGNSVGILTIRNPNRSKNFIKVALTVSAQLSSVKCHTLLNSQC